MERIELEDPRDFLDYRYASGATVEIFDIAVGSDRRKGQGRRMVNILFGRARRMEGVRLVWAITRESNAIAREFYVGLGFRVLAVLSHFYAGEDAIMYGRDI